MAHITWWEEGKGEMENDENLEEEKERETYPPSLAYIYL